MEIYANELSIKPNVFKKYEAVEKLKELYSELMNNNIKTCRISLDSLKELKNNIRNDTKYRNLLDFVYSFFKQPYESDEVNEKQEDYLEHTWQYNCEECFGLALAYIMDSMTLSLYNINSPWGNYINIKQDDNNVIVRNSTDKEQLLTHSEWLDNFNEIIPLAKPEINPVLKPIHLRDDHGKDILLDFSNRIVKSEYVLEVINSLPFNSHARQFAYRICPENKYNVIHLVLHWTDKGYGIAIKTTGRNSRETKRIAEILTEQYDQ